MVSADPRATLWRIELSAGPEGMAAAIAALEKTLAAAATPAQKAKLTAAVAALRETTYRERTTLTLDGATGLRVASRTERIAERPGAPAAVLELDETRQIP